jgi:hypothetical protein
MTCINNDIKRGLPCEESKSVLSISISAEAEDKLSITTIDKNSKVSPGNLLCPKRLNAQSTNLAWTSHHLPWWDCWFRRHACHPLTGLNLLLYTFQKKHFYLEGGFKAQPICASASARRHKSFHDFHGWLAAEANIGTS